MTFKTNKLRDAISFALVVGTAGTGVAFAQEAQQEEATTLDRIEVTGSRIKRAEVETSQPIFTLDRADIQAQGLTSVGDVIQNITANGSTLNSTFNNGGNGETRVSLRNLGSNRTLVLVNGRRWVGGTGLGGAVDLNTIPTAAVERIEVLKDGASVIYGSDAISGVVNVILRNDYQGAEANAYVGQYDKGDGTKQSYDMTIGTSDERFSAMFGAAYVKEEAVHAGDREISEFPVYKTGTSFGSSTTPDGRFGFGAAACNRQNDNGQSLYLTSTGGLTTTPQFNTNGTPRYATVAAGNQSITTAYCQPATYTRDGADANPIASNGEFRPFVSSGNPNDIYNFAPDNYLLTPQERKSVFGRATLNITDNTSAFIQAQYNNRRSEQLLAAMPVTLGTSGNGQTAFVISKDNYYNNFTNAAGQQIDVTRTQRRIVETGGRSFNQNVDTFGFTGGLEGSFEFADRFFSWDAGMVYGRNDQNDTTYGLFNVSALRNALGPSFLDTDGSIKCGTPDNPATAAVNERSVIAGCVPMNLLGGVGSITQDMLDYTSFVAHDEFGYKMKQYFANMSGEIFELPGGMLGFAAGLEKRTESGYDSPDALINAGSTTGNARTATSGGYGVEEAYLEFAIPLLKDVPGAKELEFSIAGRYSDYDNFGDTTNAKFGFKWRPIEDLLVRGNWSEGFRAPSISELFSGLADSFPPIKDPCGTGNFSGNYNGLTAEQQARCHAQGVTPGGYAQSNGQIRISVGGNPNLLPEKSETKTFGLVYSPSWLEGFDVSLDWWQIDLTDVITTFSGQFILDDCIRNNNQALCSLITRDPATSQVADLVATPINLGAQVVEGYDMTVNYRLPEQSWGKLSFTWDTTYMADNRSDNDGDGKLTDADGGSVVGEYFDRSNNWRIRSNLMTRWEMGDFGATWSARYYSRQEEECPFYYNDYGFGELCNDAILGDGPDGGEDVVQAGSLNHMGGTTYHDVSAYWKAPWNARITLGVNNIGDKNPPVSFTTFANSFDPQYEVPGRFMYLQYNQKF